MASPFQQQALRRKLIYVALVLVLLTASWLFRFAVVEAKAEQLTLRESKMGRVEVGGSALRLSLTGSRGFVICILWNWAIDAQKKNRWNELELYVRSLTKLQPHFISPWLFQSWNLAYNVSVEADQVKDKIFYVARGTELLAEGERQNKNHPELRFQIGFYQQHKICQSDENNVFKCLYQMGCIPPLERAGERFYTTTPDGRREFNRIEFEAFCKEHPQLVRRLRDKLRRNSPEEVVQFLQDNARVPSLFTDNRAELLEAANQNQPPPLKPIEERFPVLPPPRVVELPQHLYDPRELTHESLDRLNDEFDAFAAARAWYGYAQEPLPPTDPDRPGKATEITDRVRQRMSKMTVALFRNYPPRGDSYIAERLSGEGWHDASGWHIRDWFPQDRFSDGNPAIVGAGRNWAGDAWGRARDHWMLLGQTTGLYLPPIEEASKRELAKRYAQSQGINLQSEPPERPDLEPGNPEYNNYKAALYIHWYDYYRQLTNFKHHFYRAEVEADLKTVAARKAFFEAEQLRRQARRAEAIERYQKDDALKAWRQQLERYSNFRADSFIQEESYETQLKYTGLLQDYYGYQFRIMFQVVDALTQGITPGPGWAMPTGMHIAQVSQLPKPNITPAPELRMDGTFRNPDTEKMEPLISEDTIVTVRTRLGLIKPPNPTPEDMMRATPTQPPSSRMNRP